MNIFISDIEMINIHIKPLEQYERLDISINGKHLKDSYSKITIDNSNIVEFNKSYISFDKYSMYATVTYDIYINILKNIYITLYKSRIALFDLYVSGVKNLKIGNGRICFGKISNNLFYIHIAGLPMTYDIKCITK